MNEERTTKIVSVLLELTFHGDYTDADEIPGRVEGWIDSALDDRDDLRNWTTTFGPVRTVEKDLGYGS